jgi:DNA-binding XRE family transcriptional regulator
VLLTSYQPLAAACSNGSWTTFRYLVNSVVRIAADSNWPMLDRDQAGTALAVKSLRPGTLQQRIVSLWERGGRERPAGRRPGWQLGPRVLFGQRLRSLRKKKGWTQVELADYLGLDRGYVSNIERGQRNVTLETAQVVARGFGVSISQLLKGM